MKLGTINKLTIAICIVTIIICITTIAITLTR
jgi:hypothetical protein